MIWLFVLIVTLDGGHVTNAASTPYANMERCQAHADYVKRIWLEDNRKAPDVHRDTLLTLCSTLDQPKVEDGQ